MSPQYESAAEEETDARPSVIFSLIGSATFKWVLGILGTIAAFLLAFGFEAYLEAAASKNPDVVAAKADVDTLKVAVKVLSSTADNHTAALAHADEDRKHAEQVQSKIFDAIKQVSKDLQEVDKHLSGVDAHVADQAEAIKEIREAGRR
jgi:hypothetical protein